MGLLDYVPGINLITGTKNAMDKGEANSPGYNSTPPPPMSPEAQQMNEEQSARALRPQSEFTQDFNEGIGASKSGLDLSPEYLNRQAAQLGMHDSGAMAQAISNRANREYQRNFSQTQMQGQMLGRQQKLSDIDLATQYQQQQAQASLDRAKFAFTEYQNQRTAQINAIAARNGVLASVLGIAGSFGGAVAGSAKSGGAQPAAPAAAPSGASPNLGVNTNFGGPTNFNGAY